MRTTSVFKLLLACLDMNFVMAGAASVADHGAADMVKKAVAFSKANGNEKT